MTELHVVLAPVGVDVYAVPVDRVRQVVAAPMLTPLVTGPSTVLGLFSLRGQIVPLLDTSALLGLGAAEPCAFVLVLQSPEGLVGLTSTALPERASLGECVGPSVLSGTDGSYIVGGQVVVLLDLDTLLAGGRNGGERSRREIARAGVSTNGVRR
ncbi:hypothetical protein JF66_12010 [Cryobacterium sp. MLB-32]|uniref:chemotaxis protein CheW n=1 Tax=Cryobacterium sp. MLB-32 TaxID=1529318 RepID=UPI0004E72451|nr:chemotaxis protein CheW [Cryobacterium sp. MLB-32]KFF59341.1 hypothetical protein JF66_12010 [Cryobacterium sp. MLB-32]